MDLQHFSIVNSDHLKNFLFLKVIFLVILHNLIFMDIQQLFRSTPT